MSSTLKRVLVLNCGSSSLKFAIIDPDSSKEYLSGLAECLNLPEARIKWKMDGGEQETKQLGANAAHKEALDFVKNILEQKPGLSDQLTAIGHRVVHGGQQTQSAIINDEILQAIENAKPFAPLHNPAHLTGIREAKKLFPELENKNVAAFDTAFHQTMPEEAYLYALPYDELYKKEGIRRYGAHGTSHSFVCQEATKEDMLNKPLDELNVITCHLGNGGSVAAVRGGKCVDTSMGLTPLEGLVMGTRCGDIDPAIIFYLHDTMHKSVEQIKEMLTKKSGLLGLTGSTSDCRYIEDHYCKEPDAKRAMDVFCHRLAKYIGAYMALMEDHLDAVIFTGGIGENSALVRKLTLGKLKLLGFTVDETRNDAKRFGEKGPITTDGSCHLALVIPTNEELVIAQDAARLTTPTHP